MQPEQTYVYRALIEAGANADCALALGQNSSLATWTNNGGYATYERANHHTLSLYIQGGQGTRRMRGERSFGRGHPGAVCVLPAGSRSEWCIESPLSFMHLYFDREAFDKTVEQSCDVDPSSIELRDISFQSDLTIESMCRTHVLPLDWNNPADRMEISCASERLMLHVFDRYSNRKLKPTPCRGGLSPMVLNRVRDYVEASLANGITIGDLAFVAELSPFHFTRMFSESEGVSPHQYVLARRIVMAKGLLASTHYSLSRIAQECGFSSQSHLSSRFRREAGMTPKGFRRSI